MSRRRPCRACGAPTRRIRDADTGLSVYIDTAPIHTDDGLDTSQVVYEHIPAQGWGITTYPRQRGYPLHYLHICSV